MNPRPALLLALAACGGTVVRDVADDTQFVRWPTDDLVLVGSEIGLAAVDPDARDVDWITTGPVIAADVDPDGRILYTESLFPTPESGVVCAANCLLDLVRVDLDGSDPEVLLSQVVANLWDTFVPSTDRRHLALQTPSGLGILDLTSGDLVDGPRSTWAMSLSDDGAEVVYLQSEVPWEENWQHFVLFDASTGQATPVAVDDDPNAIWTWRYRRGDHRALVLDGGQIAVASLATGTRDWTWDPAEAVWAGTIAWNPDGAFVTFFTADQVLHVLDADTGDEVGGFARDIRRDVWAGQAAVSPDGTRVAWLADGHLHVEDL